MNTTDSPGSLICFAHRGASGHEPENTLLAFEKALALDSPWIEFDVHQVEDDCIVFHDYRLERLTNGSGYVFEKSLDYLRSLQLPKGQRIPLLQEVLDFVDRRCGINVEIKSRQGAERVCTLLREAMRERGWQAEQFIISSFRHELLRQVKRIAPELRIAPLLLCAPLNLTDYARSMQAYSIHPGGEFLTAEMVTEAHRNNIKVFPYTINFSDDLALLQQIGADGVFTDYPEIITRGQQRIPPNHFSQNQ